MSKYDALWSVIGKCEGKTLKLTFGEIQAITGIPIDHSFLNYKKELAVYGWEVSKISLKEQTVVFTRQQ